MNYNYIILKFINITLYYFIITYYIILQLTFILLLIYNLFKGNMVRLNWRELGCGNKTILGERLVKEANGGGDNTIEGFFFL